MKTKVYLNPEQIEHAKTLRTQGVDCQTIAAIFNVSQSTISKHTGQPRRTYTDGPDALGVYPEAEQPAELPGQVTISDAINDAHFDSLVERAESLIEKADRIIEKLDEVIKAMEVHE